MKCLLYALCILVSGVVAQVHAMKAFDPLPTDSPRLNRMKELLGSNLSRDLPGEEAIQAGSDSYSLAVLLSQCLHCIKKDSPSLSTAEVSLLRKLITDFETELTLMHKNPKIMSLEVESLGKPIIQSEIKPKPGIRKRTGDRIKAQAMSVEGEGSVANQEAYLKTFLDLTYEGVEKLQGYLSMGVRSEATDPEAEAQIELREANVEYLGAPFARSIRLGRTHKEIGNGLVQNGMQDGIQLHTDYQNYKLEMGFLDGIYASVTSNFFLDLPLTFYGMESDTGSHSGFVMRKRMNRLHLSTELAEYHKSGQTSPLTEGKNSAFSMTMGYEANDSFAIGSALTHTGEAFRARSGLQDPTRTLFHEISPRIQKEILSSLSNYFGTRENSLAGYSDLNVNLKVNTHLFGELQLHYDWLYDHTNRGLNRGNEIGVTSLYMRKALDRSGSTLALSLQNLDFARPGYSRAGLLAGVDKKDLQVIRSAYQFKF